MSGSKRLYMYGGAYATIDDARADLEHLRELHHDKHIGRYDAMAISRRPDVSVAVIDLDATVRGTGAQLRVAHGLPFNDYIGASIEMKATSRGPWTAWLLLVETIPAGTDATTVTRNLVRNLLLLNWGKAEMLLKSERRGFFESRPMSIPEGADPKRLSVVGWVEDKQGRIRSIAQSRCVPVE